MHVVFLLEEPSAEAAINQSLPRLLPTDTWRCIPHRGKDALLLRLPALLKIYARRFAHEPDLRLVLLMDADCLKARQKLEKLAVDAQLPTKTTAPAGQPYRVITRLAIAELEAWFLGDQTAIQAAYPRVHSHHFKGLLRDIDTLPNAWKTLHRLLQKGGYYPAGYLKREAAEAIAAQLDPADPARNSSPSFRYFCQELTALQKQR